MTENLLHKLEEKLMGLLTEVEELRREIQYLKYENTSLRTEKEKVLLDKAAHEKKLQELISLLDVVNVVEAQINNTIAA